MVSFHQPWFQDALWSVVNWWRSPNPHHCRWPSSALHHPWLRLPWPGSSSTQDFHLSHDLNPGLGFSGCNWVLHLRPARWSDVRHPLRARWPWEGILFHWLSRGQVFFSIIEPAKCLLNDLFECAGSCWRKSQRSHLWCTLLLTTSRSYIHSQWANGLPCCSHLNILTFSPVLSCFWLMFQGPLQVEEKWRDLYPYQVVAMMIIDKEDETAVSLSLPLHLTWPCWFVDDITRTDCWWQK